MAGGGDLGGLGGGMGGIGGDIGGGGGGGSSAADPFSGDPGLTGSDMSGGVPGMGMSSPMGFGSDGAFGGPPGAGGATTDPNYAAAESQAPAPGTTPTSVGGVQSQPQSDAQIQQIIKQLSGSGLRAQASPLEAAAAQGQGYGGGQAGTSTGLPGSITPPPPQGPGGAYGGGSPTQEATALGSSPPPPSGAPRGNVPIGATAQPIPPSDITTPTPPSSTMPGQPTPTEAASIGGPDKSVPTPPPAKTEDGDSTPALPKAKANGKDATPPPAATTPAATTPAPTTRAGTGDATAAQAVSTDPQGAYGGGSPTQQQQMNPMKMIGDLVQAMFGNPAPLLKDLAGQNQAGNWESAGNPPGIPPWAPGTGPQTRIKPGTQPPRTGAGRTGAGQPPVTPAPTTPPSPPSAEETTNTTMPGQPPPPGSMGAFRDNSTVGATGAYNTNKPAAAQAAKQIGAMPASEHANNFGQPMNQKLKQDRAANWAKLQANPKLMEKALGILYNEQGQNPQGTQAIAESFFNRSSVRHHSLEQVLRWNKAEPGGYYAIGNGYGRNGAGAYPPQLRPMLMQSLQNAANGSNISNYATDNSSGGLAIRDQQPAWQRMFQYQSNYTGETFFSPGRQSEPVFTRNWQTWVQQMMAQ